MSLGTCASVCLIALGVYASGVPTSAFAKMAADMTAVDPDADGTVSLAEARDAAAKTFEMMDSDKDGTIDASEAKGRLANDAFTMGDPDKDGTIDKAEYLAFVEAAFKTADPDGDGTLDAKELASPTGKRVLELIR